MKLNYPALFAERLRARKQEPTPDRANAIASELSLERLHETLKALKRTRKQDWLVRGWIMSRADWIEIIKIEIERRKITIDLK